MQMVAVMARNDCASISEYFSTLITQQLLLITEASKDNKESLSSLVACQLFDTIDWARMNLTKKSLDEITAKVYEQIPNIFRHPCNLKHIEKYAEQALAVSST